MGRGRGRGRRRGNQEGNELELKPRKIKESKSSIFVHVCASQPTSGAVSWIYKIDIDATIRGQVSPDMKPAYTFTIKKGYTNNMGCAIHGSKLYLMGGSLKFYMTQFIDHRDYLSLAQKEASTDMNMYPPDVYVFDCESSQICSAPSMVTGKSVHPFTFVVKDKIYVLSSQSVPKGLAMFEVFDTESSVWKKLPDLPYPGPEFIRRYKGLGSALIGSRFIVVSFGTKNFRPDITMFAFDILTQKWSHLPQCMPHLSRDSVFVKDTLYLPFTRGFFKSTHDPFDVLSYAPLDPTKLHSVRACKTIPISPSDALSERRTTGASSRMLVHLGSYDSGSRLFGFLEYFDPIPFYTGDSETLIPSLRFVQFEAPDKVYHHSPLCKAKTVNVYTFSLPDTMDSCCVINAVCAL